jgi:hypothetical protein
MYQRRGEIMTMKKGTTIILTGVLIGALICVSCRSGHEGVPSVSNEKPKFERYAQLERLYSIDVTDISMFSKESATDFDRVMSFDSRHNLYILDTYESRISVFDDKGRFARAFGRAGQGPEEFTNPNRLVIKGDRIYVFEGFTGLKILSLDGAYISKGVVNIENPLKLRAVGDHFYLLRGRTDPTFTKLEFLLTREDEHFSGGQQLFRYEYPPGLRGPNYDFGWHDWLLISEDGAFYFPEDNLNRYSIIKYGRTGRPELVFGRTYDIREYSKQAKDRFYTLYEGQIEKGERLFPQSPPVIGNMFKDEKKNVWVIAGESSEDNRDPEFENTIDIFSEKGEWLNSMKSRSLSRFCHYHDGKIYIIPSMDSDSLAQSIEVFKIRYLDLR